MSEKPQTAYELSIAAAQTMLNREADGHPADQDYAAMHKKAFRAAFDLLKELYPPKNDAEYWTFAAKRVALVGDDNKDNPLCKHLLWGLYSYLEDEVKTKSVT